MRSHLPAPTMAAWNRSLCSEPESHWTKVQVRETQCSDSPSSSRGPCAPRAGAPTHRLSLEGGREKLGRGPPDPPRWSIDPVITGTLGHRAGWLGGSAVSAEAKVALGAREAGGRRPTRRD